LADLVTRRLTRKIDWDAVVTNVLHTGFLNRAKLPIVLPDDRTLVEAALTALGGPGQVRIARIASTLQLDRIWVSEGLLPEVRGHRRLTQIGGPSAMQFDRAGNLPRLAPPN
jgi:hypothetical protein